jgi:hypothetical protein
MLCLAAWSAMSARSGCVCGLYWTAETILRTASERAKTVSTKP